MAWLFIDTHAPEAFRWGFLDQTPRVETKQGRAHDLLAELPSVNNLKTQIHGIVVVSGPGTFTAVRTGVLVANVLARTLRLPLVGVSVAEANDLMALFRSLGGRPAVTYVAPVYDREPNITQPKHS